jgi:hypothetical protein
VRYNVNGSVKTDRTSTAYEPSLRHLFQVPRNPARRKAI